MINKTRFITCSIFMEDQLSPCCFRNAIKLKQDGTGSECRKQNSGFRLVLPSGLDDEQSVLFTLFSPINSVKCVKIS